MQDLIKVKPTAIIIVVILTLGLFGIAIFFSNQSAKKYKLADFNTEIKSSTINGDEGYGSLRATIFYAEKEGVESSARLINNEFIDKKFWRSHGPMIDFDENPHHYTIVDLEFPYVLSKKENCDTLVAMKDNVKFLFKMIDIE